MKRAFSWVITLIVLAWAITGVRGSGRDLEISSNLVRILSKFYPPDFSIAPSLFEALLDTIRIAVTATAFAIFLALPLAIISSSRFGHPLLRRASLILQAGIRTIPSLVWALIAVAMVGANPLAGVIALIFYSLGYLGKFFADAIDTVPAEHGRVLLANQAHPIQALQYGLMPEIAPLLRRHCFWMLEYNIRSASIIGFVGAGGIGTQLHVYQEYGQWDKFSAVLIVLFAIVLLVETIGRKFNR
jgi:phosphonate transport system permease protein